jgi:hypothetical protein
MGPGQGDWQVRQSDEEERLIRSGPTAKERAALLLVNSHNQKTINILTAGWDQKSHSNRSSL